MVRIAVDQGGEDKKINKRTQMCDDDDSNDDELMMQGCGMKKKKGLK